MKKIILTAVILTLMCLLLLSCGDNRKPEADKEAGAGGFFNAAADDEKEAADEPVKKEERLARMYLPEPADAEDGKCGENATWHIEGDKLYIVGSGAMWDYSLTNEAPWVSRGSDIKRITVGDGITVIGSFAFANLKHLDSVNIDGDVKFIGSNAFFNSSVRDVKMPQNGDLYEIERYAFSGCSNLEEVTLPSILKYIDSYAFENCTSLYNFVMPDSVIDVGEYVFMGCSNLKTANISKNIDSIGTWAFAKCSSLETIYIPKALKKMPSGLFTGCGSLKEVIYLGSESEWNKIDFGSDNEAVMNASVKFSK